MLSHTFTLRIPADVWVRLEEEVGRELTRWIVQAIRERLDREGGKKPHP